MAEDLIQGKSQINHLAQSPETAGGIWRESFPPHTHTSSQQVTAGLIGSPRGFSGLYPRIRNTTNVQPISLPRRKSMNISFIP